MKYRDINGIWREIGAGPKGDPGFTPIITVKQNTSSIYKLEITTEDGTIITPNLRGAGGGLDAVIVDTLPEGEDIDVGIIYLTLVDGTTYLPHMYRDGKWIDFGGDGIKFKMVASLPLSNISSTTIYLLRRPGSEEIYYQYIFNNGQWILIGTSGIPIATTTTLGLVKPDGTSITIDGDGTLSVVKTYIDSTINEYLDDKDNDLEESDIDGLF